jgi:hypothetical protein
VALSRARIAATLAAVTIAGSTALAPAASARVDADISATVPVTVKVPMRTIASPGTSKGMNGILEIRVGASQPFAVMLDTGSVGLRVFPGAWSGRPSGVAVSTTGLDLPSGGQQLGGLLAKAPITIGGVTTTRSVGFQYVNTDSPYIAQWAKAGVYGILGVGTGQYVLSNPLSALPGNVGQHWSIRFNGEPRTKRPGTGALVLGAQIPEDATAVFTLPALGPDLDGALLWDDHKASGCWSFGPSGQQCIDTWFDSGFEVMRVTGSAFRNVPRTPAGAVRSGTPVSLAAAGSAFTAWRFPAGQTQSLDFVRMVPRGQGSINTGNAVFFQFTVTYDVELGRVGLSHPVAH